MEQQLQQERIVIENDDEIEIDLKDLVLEILSFWKWVLFALIIGAVTAYCISRFVMVPQYESTSQFYVLSKSMSITSLADIQTGTSLTNDYMVIVEGRPVLEQVIENLGLDETYSSLKKKVTLNNPSNSRILEITVRDANPSQFYQPDHPDGIFTHLSHTHLFRKPVYFFRLTAYQAESHIDQNNSCNVTDKFIWRNFIGNPIIDLQSDIDNSKDHSYRLRKNCRNG